MEATLALESFRLSLENIKNPTEEVDKEIKQTSSNYNGFTLNTHQAIEATNNLVGALSIGTLEFRKMLDTAKPSDCFRCISRRL